MIFTFIDRACSDLPVAVCCRVMKVSTSGFYAWLAQPCSDRDHADAVLTSTIVDIHRMSRRSYGSPRVHAELRLGLGTFCSRKRVERLMRQAGVAGIHRRRRAGCTRRDLDAQPSDDLVARQFDPVEADRLWVMDVTEHPTSEGKVYLAVVLDAFSRRVVGWSIADHVRSELVVDAVQMAIWRRQPPEGQVVAHSDHGSTYTSWAFGRRLRGAGLLGSMGSIGDCFDKALVSHCTSWCRLDGDSRGEPAAHALDEPGVAGGGRLEEPFVLVVGLVGHEQAGAAPGLDGGAVHAETFGDLVEGQQAFGPEPLGVAGQDVRAA